MHDIFETATALIFSFVVILLMTQFRIQSDDLKSKYYSLSRLDGLTGILNKTAGTEMIREYIEKNRRKESFALALLDVDDFKSINDTYGHESGDNVLKAVGLLLSETFRSDDIVCRYGGDEFLILMKNISMEDCDKKLTLLEKRASDSSLTGNISISVSTGLCAGVCGKNNSEEILNNADEALYSIKHNGKKAHIFYKRER